jgi:hypothetical protein
LPNTQFPQTIFCGWWPHWNLRAKAKKYAIIIANKPSLWWRIAWWTFQK